MEKRKLCALTKKIRLIELFGGVGTQAMALRDIGADFEHYKLVEFDQFAVASYNAVHGTDFVPTDIRDVHGADLELKERALFTYLLTYSFPCTNLSVAGRMEGMKKGSRTRSGLLWEVERILEELGENLPDILIMENVTQVHGKKNYEDFETWCNFLKDKGYSNFWQDMNAADYGVPQNRNRCFMVSILGDFDYVFPETFESNATVDDYLESCVEEKYFLKSAKAEKLLDNLKENGVLEAEQSRATSQFASDLSVNKTRKIEKANCIVARYDAGISNQQSFGTGVVVHEM